MAAHNLFILSYVYKWAFLDLFESKNSLVFCTCQRGQKTYIKRNILGGQTGSIAGDFHRGDKTILNFATVC